MITFLGLFDVVTNPHSTFRDGPNVSPSVYCLLSAVLVYTIIAIFHYDSCGFESRTRRMFLLLIC